MAGIEADIDDMEYKKNNSYTVLNELGRNILKNLNNNFQKDLFINMIDDIISALNCYDDYPVIFESPVYLELFRIHLDAMLYCILSINVKTKINDEWNKVVKKYYPKDDIFRWTFPRDDKPDDEKQFWNNYCNSKTWWD